MERWARSLSVMLEKIFGCSLVSKLRAILIQEAGSNCVYKIIFGYRMMENARHHNLVPTDIYSERGRTADNGTLAKTLAFDVIRQTRLPAGITLVDADGCFDGIAHPIASLIFQALGVNSQASEAILTTIQEMKFFLRTA
jgi:hypothetical protein